MPIKQESKVEFVVARILEQMPGERWAELCAVLATKGIRAMIAMTSLAETKIIQEHVNAYHASIAASVPPPEPLFSRLQSTLKQSLEAATSLPWPALYQENFDA